MFSLAGFVPGGGMQMLVLGAVSGLLTPWISDIVLELDRFS